MSLNDLKHELGALMTSYPSFVMRRGGTLEMGEVPVFVFHTIEPREFEEHLEHIVSNRYKPLSLREFLDTMSGRRKPGDRELLLTFDDARSSFWIFAYPLLKRHGIQATVFAITGWTPDAPARPNLEDCWSGRTSVPELKKLDEDDRGVCSWDELRQMHASGLVTVDSHSHLHRRVFVDRDLQGIIAPTDDFSPSSAIHSPYLSCPESPAGLPTDRFVGLPLFRTRGFLEDGAAVRLPVESCAEFQARASEVLVHGAGEIRKRDLDMLRTLLPVSAFRKISPEESRAEMLEDLGLARETLRSRLADPEAGQALCLPFTLGGESVVSVARELGLQAVFWGVSRSRANNRPGLDQMHHVRLKHDFLWRLPGHGRRSVSRIYSAKIIRRLSGERPY